FTEVKTASTPIETQEPLLKDTDGEEVDVHMYWSMIGSLMYLTSSRPDIMFAVCACARYQVDPKVSHLQAVKRIFSSKTAAWNEFSSTMASANICLATNQKFNFSKYIFESMVKNLDNVSRNFLMYPRSENVSKHSNDPLLARGNTLRSGEDRLKLEELMALYTTLQLRVLTLETIKTTQANEITSLKRRVKKLEQKKRSITHRLKILYRVGSSRMVESSKDEGLGEVGASKQGRIADIDANEDIYLVNVRTNEDMFGGNDLDGDEVIIESVDAVNTAEETRTLAELKSAKPKATTITTTPTLKTTIAATTITAVSTRPIDKGLVIHEHEQAPTPTNSSQQPSQVKVQDKAEEEERHTREKAQQMEEANIAWDDVQAKRTEEKRNISPTRAQKRSIMCTYLKNMEGWKPKSLKNKSFANIQELFDKAMKRVNTFVDYKTELVEESSKKEEAEIAHESSLKRAGEELEQESFKKQKLEEDKVSKELKQCLEIVPDDGDDVTIDATPLSTKSPTIMLKNFDREDLEVLWSIVKARFKKIEAVNYMDNFLLLNLKTTFEHHVEDNVWKNRQGLVKVLN
ncbi:hypothetical protein Tco_0495879, partial [Tanacetum coccineum]